MFLIDKYIVKLHEGTQLIMHISIFKMLSPCCQADLKFDSNRKRTYIDENGKHMILLQRFRCKKCKNMHTQLPSFLHPYRRYVSPILERCIDEEDADKCPVLELSTFYKIKRAFVSRIELWLAALQSIRKQFTSPASDPTLEGLPTLEMPAIREKKGWLSRVARMLANYNYGYMARLSFYTPHS